MFAPITVRTKGFCMRRSNISATLVTLVACMGFALLPGCGDKPNSSGSKPTASVQQAEIEFPEGDPNVKPEDGGPGFTGEGWTTADPGYLGDPNAVKGGTITTDILGWPANLRMYGTTSNSYLNYIMGWQGHLLYESLINMHPDTLEVIPMLASHWKISEDQKTFTFRIDPRAHWSDGKPVTSEDVLATYKLIMDETLLDPARRQQFLDFEPPKALSKYIVEVTAKTKRWINFYIFGGMILLPAHEIGSLTGKEYLDKYNFAYTAVTGPYIVKPEDIKTNQAVILTRRPDYWAKDYPRNKGLYNFDKIRFLVVRESRLAFDKLCNGELDFQLANTAKWFVEDAEQQPAVQKNYVVRRKFFTQAPNGIQGFAFNMREAPLNDVLVRRAIGYLYDRVKLVEKFAFGEYLPIDSYFPGAPYANPDNEKIRYNPEKAVELLTQAGWTERGPDGILVKDGKRLSLTILYNTDGLEKYFTSLQESCAKVGVEIKLSLTTPENLFKNLMERKFQVASMAWGASIFPNPESNWHSELADKEGSNNFVGFKNKQVDELMEKYNQEFDLEKRHELLRQIDGLIYAEHAYSMAWYMPSQRVMYWDKFGMPEYGIHRFAEWDDVFATWWEDPEKVKRLQEARKAGKALPPTPIEHRYWENIEASKTQAN